MSLYRIPARWVRMMRCRCPQSTGLLAVTLIVGTGSGAAEGVKSFIRVAGFQFQPAEAAKIVTALALAKLLARQPDGPASLRDLVKPMALVALPLGLVILQPDLGTALAFIGMLFAAIYWAGTSWPLMLFAASPGLALILSFDTRLWSAYVILLVIALYLYRYRLYLIESLSVVVANLAAGAIAQPLWNSLAQYQRNRILVFLDPEIDPQGAGWQLLQSKVAVGSGGVRGRAYTRPQKRLNSSPSTYRFISTYWAKNSGFWETLWLFFLFGYFFFRMIRMARPSTIRIPASSSPNWDLLNMYRQRDDDRRRSHHGDSAALRQLWRIVPADGMGGGRDYRDDGERCSLTRRGGGQARADSFGLVQQTEEETDLGGSTGTSARCLQEV